MTPCHPAVHRRHVFFLSGFDPKGASYYHALYRAQAALQSAVSGYPSEVGQRRRTSAGANAWSVRFQSKEEVCETNFEFCRWDDIVRQHWTRSTAALLAETLRQYVYALSSGVIPRIWRLARRPALAWSYPAAFLMGLGAVAVLLAVLAHTLSRYAGGGALASWVSAVVTFWAVIVGGIHLERRLNTTWLARIYSFARTLALNEAPEVEQRIDAVASAVVHAVRANEVDEVLVVGFSVGSLLAVSVAARALRELQPAPDAAARPVVSLLTLGHCIPMLGLLPEAQRFRGELQALAADRSVTWVDFSSPTDWGSFALVDPVSACLESKVRRVAGLPTMRSPRFHTLFPTARYMELRRDKRRMHLQYLMAGEVVGGYDYFKLTAGVRCLGESAGVVRGAAA